VWAAPATNPALPTFVFFHGNASSITDFTAFGEGLHRRGWGVIPASYHGCSGHDGKPSKTGLTEDARAILDAIDTKGPRILWGHSLGTSVAARMAREGQAQALVLDSPYTLLTDIAASRFSAVPMRSLTSDPFDTASLVLNIKGPVDLPQHRRSGCARRDGEEPRGTVRRTRHLDSARAAWPLSAAAQPFGSSCRLAAPPRNRVRSLILADTFTA
jgi:pimeloyl-ACP methyl ester carboxylesterase